MSKYSFKLKTIRCTAAEKRLFSCLAFLCLLAAWQQPASATDAGYTITSYHSEIQIGTDNVYHITETIKVYFDEPSHGIYRYIPYVQKMSWKQDGTMTRAYHTKVESVTIPGETYTVYRENGNVVVQIGDPNITVTGEKTYTIKYDHALGYDKIENLDFVYYNIVGTQWDCAVDQVTFHITMPKTFDPAGLRFFTGAFGSTAVSGVTYTAEGTDITGTLDTPLGPGEGLTIQMDLPQGYFGVASPFPWSVLILAVSAGFALLGLILYLLYGKDPHLAIAAEYYPPQEITSAEAGYIIDNATDDKDIVSLVIYWASKGYLRIEQIEKSDFKLIKLKELSERPEGYQSYFFGKLFENRREVPISDLQEKIYPAIEETKKRVSLLYEGKDRRLYTKTSVFLGGLLSLFAALLILGSLLYVMYETVYSFSLFTIAAFLIFTILILLTLGSLKEIIGLWNGLTKLKRSLKLAVRSFLSLTVLILYIAYFYFSGVFLAGAASAGAALVLTILSAFMRKRTEYGNEILGKLLGFKSFLELAEQARLERLVEENPSYFYDIIPFAYVLGVSEAWAKKFEGIAMRPPEWYTGTDTGLFTPFLFQAALLRSMLVMSNAMTARPVRSAAAPGIGGGGFGGGGFGGGGFGGGGGGRW